MAETSEVSESPRVVSLNQQESGSGDKQGKHFSDTMWGRALRHILHDKLTLAALTVVIAMAALALLADPISAYVLHVDPDQTDPAQRLLPPGTPEHILGTDDLGRDYLSRLLYGGRISLAIGFSGSIITLAIGLSLGMMTGYYGGVVDDVMNWIITTLDSIPGLYLLILLSALLRPGPETLVLLLALTGWTGGTRLMRGQTIALRHRDYVLAAQAIGVPVWRILFVHIMPNLLSITLIALASGIGGLIVAESTLSYLGLGVQPPVPTWGNMLSNAEQFFYNGPHLAIISGLTIFITVLCMFVLGDGLRDAFDPQITR